MPFCLALPVRFTPELRKVRQGASLAIHQSIAVLGADDALLALLSSDIGRDTERKKDSIAGLASTATYLEGGNSLAR